MPGPARRGHPAATYVGNRHPPLIQQPPQPDTAICTPTMLSMDAARMSRLIGYDHRAAAPSAHDTSNRIHALTVEVVRQAPQGRCPALHVRHVVSVRGLHES